MRSLIVVALTLGIVLLSLLFYASDGSSTFSDTLPTLFIGGAILGVALLILLGWRMWWLQKRIRRGIFGAKLTLKLLLMFGAVAMLPGLVVYGASVFFLIVRSKPGSTCGWTMHWPPASISARPRWMTCCAISTKKPSTWH